MGGEYPFRAMEIPRPEFANIDTGMGAVYAGPQIFAPVNQNLDQEMIQPFEMPVMRQQLPPAAMMVYAGPEEMSGEVRPPFGNSVLRDSDSPEDSGKDLQE